MRRTSRRRFSSLFLLPLEDRSVPSAAFELTAWGPSRFGYPDAQVPAFSDITATPASLLAQTPDLTLTLREQPDGRWTGRLVRGDATFPVTLRRTSP